MSVSGDRGDGFFLQKLIELIDRNGSTEVIAQYRRLESNFDPKLSLRPGSRRPQARS